MSIPIGIELRRGNSSNADFMNQEPAELKVTRPVCNMRREWVVFRELDRGHVCKDKVAAFGVRVLLMLVFIIYCPGMEAYRNFELIKHLTETLHLVLHLVTALIPETLFLCFLKSNGCGLLERRDTAVADAGVCAGNVFNQVLRSDQVANAPAGGVESLTSRANSKSALIVFRLHGSQPSEGHIVETVIDLVRKNDEVVLDREVTNALEFSAREDLANRVVTYSLVSTNLMREAYGELITCNS